MQGISGLGKDKWGPPRALCPLLFSLISPNTDIRINNLSHVASLQTERAFKLVVWFFWFFFFIKKQHNMYEQDGFLRDQD